MPIFKELLCAGESFLETDQRYLQADSGGNRDDGCTAVTAVIVGNRVVVAHVGDSRAVLAKTGKGEQPSTCSCIFPDKPTCQSGGILEGPGLLCSELSVERRRLWASHPALPC